MLRKVAVIDLKSACIELLPERTLHADTSGERLALRIVIVADTLAI